MLDVQKTCPSCAYRSSWGIPSVVQEHGRKNRWVSRRNGSDQSGRQKAFHLEVCGHAEVLGAALKIKGSVALMEGLPHLACVSAVALEGEACGGDSSRLSSEQWRGRHVW